MELWVKTLLLKLLVMERPAFEKIPNVSNQYTYKM